MMCGHQNVRPDFCQNPEIVALNQVVNISVPSCNEALHSPMIVADRLVGSITKVWQPFTSIHTHLEHARHQWCVSKMWPDFCQILKFLPWTRLNISAPSCNEALYSPMIVADRLVGSITKVWQPFTSIHTHLEHARHQWCVTKNVARFLSESWNSCPEQDSISVHHLAMRHCIHQWLLQ